MQNFGPTIQSQFLPWTKQVNKILSETVEEKDSCDLTKLGSKGIYPFCQSYMIIDDAITMVGNFCLYDDHEEYSNVILGRAEKYFVDWAKMNFERHASDNAHVTDKMMVTNFKHSNSINDKICEWIRESKNSLYIETPLFLSAENFTNNKIANAIVERLARAYFAKDDKFECVILVNSTFKCFTLFESSEHLCMKMNYTIEFIYDQLKNKHNINSSLEDRFFIGESKITNSSSVIIIDDKKCILSSLSLCDFPKTGLAMIIDDAGIISKLKTGLASKYNLNIDDNDIINQIFEHKCDYIMSKKMWDLEDKSTAEFKIYDRIFLHKLLGKMYII